MSSPGRIPIWFPSAPQPGIRVFAILFMVEAMSRASIAALIPLQTYALLHEARYVSYANFGVAVFGLLAGFFVPLVIRLISRRWTYTLGGVCLIAAAVSFATHTVSGQIIGMAIRNFGTICISVTVALYIMDYLQKHQFVRNDSVRMALSTISWTIGPYLGVLLYERIGDKAAFGWSAVWAVIMLACFWYFRMSDTNVIIPAKQPPVNPLRFIPVFVRQPRLRLAWLIAFGRSAFWMTLFVYMPILLKKTGFSAETAGLLISASQLLLGTAILWGKLGERIGLRVTITMSFVLMAVSLVLAGVAGEAWPLVATAMLLVACLFATSLDSVGGTPFYRAVKPRERPQMTAVYRSYMDIGDLAPNFVYGIALAFFGIGSVFVINGILSLAVAAVCWRHLPKSM